MFSMPLDIHFLSHMVIVTMDKTAIAVSGGKEQTFSIHLNGLFLGDHRVGHKNIFFLSTVTLLKEKSV